MNLNFHLGFTLKIIYPILIVLFINLTFGGVYIPVRINALTNFKSNFNKVSINELITTN